MIVLNFQNIEDLVLKNKKIISEIKDLRHITEQWLLTYRLPFMKNLRKQCVIDLLNSLNDDHVKIIENHLEDTIVISRLDRDISKNLECDLNDIKIGDVSEFQNFTLSRDSDKMYFTFWR